MVKINQRFNELSPATIIELYIRFFNMRLSYFVFMIILLVLTNAYAIYRLYETGKELESKNIRLIQFYLDMKFLWNCASENLKITDADEFCYRIISEIKDYYSLEDIVIVDSIKMARNNDSTPLRGFIVDYVRKNISRMAINLEGGAFLTKMVNFEDKEYTLYLSSISPEIASDGLVICIESQPSLLNENELISLESAVNLLKSRLIHG